MDSQVIESNVPQCRVVGLRDINILCGRTHDQELHLPRTVPVPGIRRAYFPGELARYQSVSASAAREALSYGHSRSHFPQRAWRDAGSDAKSPRPGRLVSADSPKRPWLRGSEQDQNWGSHPSGDRHHAVPAERRPTRNVRKKRYVIDASSRSSAAIPRYASRARNAPRRRP
jgi:hypothetical protein